MSDIVDDDPYNPFSTDYKTTTPPLDQVIRSAIEAAALQDFNVCRPAIITAVNGSQYVNIKILLMAKYKASLFPTILPDIQDVPVLMPAGSLYSMQFPLVVGDVGLAIFSDRSIEAWTVAGGVVDPADSRSHSLSDAMFIPGLIPRIAQKLVPSTDLSFGVPAVKLNMTQTGQVQIKNDVVDAIAAIKSFVDTMTTATTIVGGPFDPATIIALKLLSTQLATIVKVGL